MGLISDFIVANPEDALQYEQFMQAGQVDRFEIAEYKNYTPLALEMLWAILSGEECDVGRYSLEHVAHSEGGETVLERLPDELVGRIACLDDSAVDAIAEKWGLRYEVPGDGEDQKPMLRDLRRLAAHSLRQEKGLYIWICV